MITINGEEVEYSYWPGGELKVRLELDERTTKERINIVAWLYNSDDIILLGLVINSLVCMGILRGRIHIPYLPYARQDRVCEKGEPFSSQFFQRYLASIIPHRGFEYWYYEPHSVYSLPEKGTINAYCVMSLAYIVLNHNKVFRDKILIAPDKGAESRVSLLGEQLRQDYIVLDKERVCGTVKYLPLYNIQAAAIKGQDVIIVDDICDGGRTFLSCAEVLKEAGVKDLYLYTVHGIYSYSALEKLQHVFKKIYCSFLHPDINERYFKEHGGEVLDYVFE